MGQSFMEANTGKIWNKVFTCTFIANFLQCISMFMINPLIANYVKLLGADEVMIGLLSGLYFGVAVAARPFSGPAISKMNKKHIMLFSYAIGVAVNIGYAISGGIPSFVAPRFMQGIQFAFMGSLNMTLASDSLPPDKMGSGLGLFGVGGAIANAIAPSLGMALRSLGERTFGSLMAGYNVVFLAAAACILISLVPCAIMPYTKPSKEELSKLGAWYKNIFAREALIPAAVVTFMSVSVICYTIYIERFVEAKGIGGAGLFFTVYALALLASRPLCGRLIDKYGTAKVFMPSACLFALSNVIVGFCDSLAGLLVGAAVAAIAYGASQPAMQTMCILSVEPLRRGVASNTNFFGIDLGNFVGPIIAGVVIGRFGFLGSLSLGGGGRVEYSPLFLLMVVPVLISMAIFAIGWKSFNRNLAKR
jgi:MFS family permease